MRHWIIRQSLESPLQMPSEIAPDPTADSPNRSHIVIDTPDDNGNEVFARVRKVNKTIDITDLSDPQDA